MYQNQFIIQIKYDFYFRVTIQRREMIAHFKNPKVHQKPNP